MSPLTLRRFKQCDRTLQCFSTTVTRHTIVSSEILSGVPWEIIQFHLIGLKIVFENKLIIIRT